MIIILSWECSVIYKRARSEGDDDDDDDVDGDDDWGSDPFLYTFFLTRGGTLLYIVYILTGVDPVVL